MSSLGVRNFDSAPSSMPKLQQIIHFPQVNALVPGLNVLEYIFSLESAFQRVFRVVFFLFVPLNWLRKGQGLHRLRLVASVHSCANGWWCRRMSHTDKRSQPAPSLKYLWLIFCILAHRQFHKSIIHSVYPTRIFHNYCFQSLLGITVVQKEREDNGYAKVWG